jgi:serine/threonine-protein kinase
MSDITARLSTALADRYTIQHELGSGGMATVYLAEDLKHHRKVAVKVLRPELAAVLGAERFLKEIEVTANLQHPHILPLFDSGEADGFLFYVMPHVEGESLRDRLNRDKQLPVEEAVNIAEMVASALDYAHRHDIVHRDIKPENILLHDEQALVADFGIALAVSAAAGARMTETGLSLGTPHYMSPEQATADRDITGRSDVYSLACVTYEMLAGDPPYLGNTAQAIIAKIISDVPRPVSELRATVPGHVELALHKALEKLPADRFRTAKAFADALTNPAFTLPTMGPGVAPTSAVANWRQQAFIPLASVTVAAIAVAFWGWMRPDPPPAVARFTLELPAGQKLASTVDRRVAIAPDGSRFAYIGQAERSDGQIWIRELDQLAATALRGTEGACCPAFSPDGRAMAFRQDGKFKVMSLDGGSPVALSDSVFASGMGGVDWGPDGSVYIAQRGLLRVASTGGQLEVVTPQDSSRRWHLWPDVLPNGKGALFTLGLSETWTANTIAVTDFATGDVRELVQGVTARYLATGHLVYVRADGVLFVAPFDQDRMELTGPATPIAVGLGIRRWGATDLAVSETGTLLYTTGAHEPSRQVVWVTRDGVETPVDPDWLGPYESVALSPDGRRLAVGTGFGAEPQLWIKSLDTGPLTKLTFEGSMNRRPTWMANGQAVTFISDRGTNRDLYMKRADGVGAAEPVMDLAVHVDEGFWSPNGDWLIYRTGISGGEGRDIFAWRSGPDSVTVPVAADPGFDERSPALSPDGRWLAYVSDESGRWEVYVRPFPDVDAGRWQISVRGGGAPAWAHSGQELFYMSEQRLMAVDVVTTPTFAPGQEKVLFSVAGYFNSGTRSGYDMTADDQRFLMIQDEEALVEGDLVIVQNFFEELKAKVGN